MMKVWNVTLVILTFLLTMIGTFLTRSGIVQSVHAFGNDPELAARFLGFIGFMTVFSFGYVIYRLPLLRSRGELDSWVSREFAFLVNNWVLLGGAFFVLTATLFPTLSEAITQNRITVGPPFFNKWMAPVGLMLLLLTGVGPLIAWRKASAQMLLKQFRFPASVAVLTAGLVGWLIPASRANSAFMHDKIQIPASLICFGLAGLVIGTIAQEFYVGARARQTNTKSDLLTALIGLVARNKRRYGGYLVHVGVVLMFVGFAGQTYQKETDVTLDKGQVASLGQYQITYENFRKSSDPQKEITEVTLTIRHDGKRLGELRPAKWAYRGHEDEPPRTVVTIRESLREDLYIILNGIDEETGLASIKVIINPLVNWVWFGFVLLIMGTAIAFLPERAYALVSKPGAGPSPTAAAVLLLLAFGGASLGSPATAHALTLAAAGDSPMHQASEGNNFPTPARSNLERDLRKTIVCMCGCGRQTLAECTCASAAKERNLIGQMIDEGKTRQDVVAYFMRKYPGESALVVPIDAGFNRLAWILPLAMIGIAGGALVVAARRWGKNDQATKAKALGQPSAPGSTAGGKSDAEYLNRLDDDLDDLS